MFLAKKQVKCVCRDIKVLLENNKSRWKR